MQYNSKLTNSTILRYQPLIAFPKPQDNTSQVKIMRLDNPTTSMQVITSSPHKRSHSQYRSSLTIKSKADFDGYSTHIPQNNQHNYIDKIEVLNSRIQSLQEQNKIMRNINSAQFQEIQQKQKLLKYNLDDFKKLNQQKVYVQNKYHKLQQQMQSILVSNKNNIRCLKCEQNHTLIKIKDTTIKFYQDQVSKINRLNSELKVEKIDLMNELSQLRLNINTTDAVAHVQNQSEMQRLRDLEIELEQQNRFFKNQNTNHGNYNKQNKQSDQNQDQKQYQLESEIRHYKTKSQQLEFQMEQIKQQINQIQMKYDKIEKELVSEKKLRKLLQESTKTQNKGKDDKNQIHQQLITMQRRFQLKCQQVNMLTNKLKNLQSTNSSFKSTTQSNYSIIKNSYKQKQSELKQIKQKLQMEEKQKTKYRTQLNNVQIQLQQANKLFISQLGLVQTKIEEYNNHLQDMEKEIENLHQQNSKLKQRLCEKQTNFENKNSDENKTQGHSHKKSQILIEQNRQLNKKVQQLVRENSRIFKDFARLNNYKSENSKVVQEMKNEAFDLFKKIEQFQSKIYKQIDIKTEPSSFKQQLEFLRNRYDN